MHWKNHDRIPLSTLGMICFLTIFMSHTYFKIANDIHPDTVLRHYDKKECNLFWLYGSEKTTQYVLSAVVVVSSPLMSVFSTAILLIGQYQMNPYYFFPWLMLTCKGLLTIQIDNFINFFKILTGAGNSYGIQLETWKWCTFYSAAIVFNIVEGLAYYEVLMHFKNLWNTKSYILTMQLKHYRQMINLKALQAPEDSKQEDNDQFCLKDFCNRVPDIVISILEMFCFVTNIF